MMRAIEYGVPVYISVPSVGMTKGHRNHDILVSRRECMQGGRTIAHGPRRGDVYMIYTSASPHLDYVSARDANDQARPCTAQRRYSEAKPACWISKAGLTIPDHHLAIGQLGRIERVRHARAAPLS
jgi:hypothetical protein